MDAIDFTLPDPGMTSLNPAILKLARDVASRRALTSYKQALVPAGAAMGGAPPGAGPDPSMGGPPPGAGPDPSMGGTPPPDPSAGGAAPMDPQIQQIANLVIQSLQSQGGGAGGAAGGKGGGKKAEQQMLDVKLWQILNLLVQMAQAQGLKVDPSIAVGPAPDPAMMQQAQQEMSIPGGGGASAQPAVPPGGAPAPDPSQGGQLPPIQPMDATTGPIGKQAFFIDGVDIGIGSEYTVPDFIKDVTTPRQTTNLAARARAALAC